MHNSALFCVELLFFTSKYWIGKKKRRTTATTNKMLKFSSTLIFKQNIFVKHLTDFHLFFVQKN